MGDKSHIEWTDATWNPTTGCDHVSEGCDHCYAETMAKRLAGRAGYPADEPFRLTLHPDRLDQPLRWKRPRRIFVNSMSDLFHPQVPASFIDQVFEVMRGAYWHTFQILTKRPQRMASYLGPLSAPPGDHIWLGTSIESDRFCFRADHLRRAPASVRFLSLEPLLGALPSLDLSGIDWVIVGGESGAKARPMHPAWARDIRDRCKALTIPFLFKQWGAWRYVDEADQPGAPLEDRWPNIPWQPLGLDGTLGAADWIPEPGDAAVQKVGKRAAGRTLDGETWDEYPTLSGDEPEGACLSDPDGQHFVGCGCP